MCYNAICCSSALPAIGFFCSLLCTPFLRCCSASAAMVSLWSERLAKLQQRAVITGFVLITPQGPLEASGTFVDDCAEGLSIAVQQLIKPFYSASSPPTTHEIWGTKLLVINQTDSQFVAVSKQRRLGILAVNLPGGILLATFDRTVQPEAAVAAVKDAYTGAVAGSSINS